MAIKERFKTNYPGVFYIIGQSLIKNKPEKIYYIRFRKDGRETEEKAGRQFQDNMTPAKANTLRAEKINGTKLTNQGKRAEIEAIKEAEAGRWTIERLWAEYKRCKSNLKGIITDENRYKLYLSAPFGDKQPSELLSLNIHRLRISLLKKKSPGTVKNVLELLRRILNFGKKNRLCEGINFIIEMPEVDNEKTEDLSPEQLSSLLQTLDESTDIIASNMMRMALFTGMRRGELFKLQWDDIDFGRGFVFLRDPKGNKGQKIPLNDGARQTLAMMPKTSTYVFPGKSGGQRVDINKAVNKIKRAAGLPDDFRPLHGLRHTYASMLASSGKVDIYTLQKLMTHKSAAMTQRYAHLRDDALKQASDLASDLIDQAFDIKILAAEIEE
ncbi:site-specific integrase [Desulforhopalus sp. IMCC35007]|uniref:tyrosine-type recombinase/integrase n=1 Tax=Desulforhopalus sp. IMCC35007 TaxID=2569543 RepID=UPI0010AE6930|nr:site-specific integrase [Desulforhopalus sp. IMCC35007]TKB12258.1 site-specific integrase [Desulforhopalus sp. IMCC35007]